MCNETNKQSEDMAVMADRRAGNQGRQEHGQGKRRRAPWADGPETGSDFRGSAVADGVVCGGVMLSGAAQSAARRVEHSSVWMMGMLGGERGATAGWTAPLGRADGLFAPWVTAVGRSALPTTPRALFWAAPSREPGLVLTLPGRRALPRACPPRQRERKQREGKGSSGPRPGGRRTGYGGGVLSNGQAREESHYDDQVMNAVPARVSAALRQKYFSVISELCSSYGALKSAKSSFKGPKSPAAAEV